MLRKISCACLVVLALGGCNTMNGGLALSAAGQLAGAFAPALCSTLTHNAPANAQCLTDANDLITVGQAIAAGHIRH